MTTHLLTVRPDWSLDRLAEFFIEHDISGAPVISQERRLLGVVSSTDLVRYRTLPVTNPPASTSRASYFETLRQTISDEEVEAFRLGGDGETTVEDIMSRAVFDIDEQTSLPEIAHTMVQADVHRVFVTRDDVLVGVVSSMDILRFVALPFDSDAHS